ncbi:MAG: hypothetical protein AAF604_15640 [Acidobacteriota bacterium]
MKFHAIKTSLSVTGLALPALDSSDADRASPRPTRSRGFRIILSLLSLAFLALTIEGTSFLGWAVMEGSAFTYGRAAALRAAVGAEPAPEVEIKERSPVLAKMRMGGQVVHPFLGFVYSTDLNEEPERQDSHVVVGEDGFWRYRHQTDIPDHAVRVSVFGGSVAFGFSFGGRKILTQELSRAIGREVRISSHAQPGFKQPQQLMTLAWLMSHDETPDIVINLDGFNDVALPMAENLPAGTYPFFPRAWEHFVRSVPDLERQTLAGERAFHHNRRLRLAERTASSPLRWSVSHNLLWRWRDRRIQSDSYQAQQKLLALQKANRSYVASGPAYSFPNRDHALRAAVGFWAQSSEVMHGLATSAGSRYYHLLQPNQYVADSKPMSAAERQTAIDARNLYMEPAQTGYPLLQAEGARLRDDGIPFFDLTLAFRQVQEPLYIDSCCHFNQLGNEVLAREVARIIVEDLRKNPLPLRNRAA